MTDRVAVWSGLKGDLDILNDAVNRYCACQYDEAAGVLVVRCPAHEMLLDQASLNHLVFLASLRQMLIDQEGRRSSNRKSGH